MPFGDNSIRSYVSLVWRKNSVIAKQKEAAQMSERIEADEGSVDYNYYSIQCSKKQTVKQKCKAIAKIYIIIRPPINGKSHCQQR